MAYLSNERRSFLYFELIETLTKKSMSITWLSFVFPPWYCVHYLTDGFFIVRTKNYALYKLTTVFHVFHFVRWGKDKNNERVTTISLVDANRSQLYAHSRCSSVPINYSVFRITALVDITLWAPALNNTLVSPHFGRYRPLLIVVVILAAD